MHFLKKIKEILFNSEKFFLNLSKEKGIQDSLLFYVILLAFSVLMNYLFKISLGEIYTKSFYNIFNLNLPLPEYDALSLIPTTILGYIIAVALSFLLAGILYVWLIIFGGKKDYAKAYQLYIYSETPSLLLNWIPIVSFFAWIYSFILLILGTKKIYEFSTAKSVLIYLIPLILFGILALFLLTFAVLTLGNLNPLTRFS